MLLYDGGRAPNPRRVRIFLAEKGIEIPRQPVDLGRLEHKGDAFTAINPLQCLPALVLDDGTILTESVAICRYIEALHPEPNLFGRTPLEIARIEMWSRRIEFELYLTVRAVFRHLHPGMAAVESPQVPDWAEANRPRVSGFLDLLDRELADRPFAAGERFTVADIVGLVSIDLMKPAKLALPDTLRNVRRWHAEIAARPSAAA